MFNNISNSPLATATAPARSTAIKLAQTVGYYGAFIAQGLVATSLGPTLPSLAEHTQVALSEVSFLFAARALGNLVGAFYGGMLYDRFPGHPVIAVSLILMAAMMALVPLTPELWLLAAVLIFAGAGMGTLNLGGNILLAWVHRDQLGLYMNGLHFCFGIGAFLGPLVIAQVIAASGDLTGIYWILSALTLPVLIPLLWAPSPNVKTPSHDDPTNQIDYRLVVLFTVFLLVYVGAEGGFGSWIFTYAVAQNPGDETVAAYLTSAFWGALTLGRLLSIPIAVRFRPRSILIFDLAGCLSSVAIILLWPGSLTALWLGTLGLGLSMASVFPTALSFVQRRMSVTGRVTGWFMIGASVGSMLLPWMIGVLIERFGEQVILLALLADLIVTAGIFALLMFYWNRPTRAIRVFPVE